MSLKYHVVEPKNMAYMTRLGLWGRGQAFPEFNDFINAVEKRGVGAMEVVAMDMKVLYFLAHYDLYQYAVDFSFLAF